MKFLLPFLSLLMLTGISLPSWAEDAVVPNATSTPTTTTEPMAMETTGPKTDMAAADAAPAEEAAPTEDDGTLTSPVGGISVNILWTVIAAILVFWMQAGFALVEAGFTRAKNLVNIMMKNLFDFCAGSIVFWLVGFGIMFGTKTATGGFFGMDQFASAPENDTWFYAFLLFQTVFAATAATIVSGAMAERTKFVSYLIYSVVISAVIYPIFGGWAWGGLWGADSAGWLGKMGFGDFAGSTVVHSIGGWCALAGAIVIGPRIGKFGKDGRVHPIAGHSMALATLGVFILWMGWFGFNAGSTTGVTGGGNAPFGGVGKAFALIAVNTNLAACAGGISAMIVAYVMSKKFDIGMSLNGVLAGLVAITAPCANVTPMSALIIGLIAGVLVVLSVLFFDKIKIDDPVGAVSVHGVCGAFGTICVALFDHTDTYKLSTQLIGVGTAFVWAFGMALILFLALKYTIGLRVSAEEEEEGLDFGEHGAKAYILE